MCRAWNEEVFLLETSRTNGFRVFCKVAVRRPQDARRLIHGPSYGPTDSLQGGAFQSRRLQSTDTLLTIPSRSTVQAGCHTTTEAAGQCS